MGSRVRQLRNELKLTQESLARRLGIGKSALSMIETGKAALSERNKRILVQTFNVNPEWINTGRGQMFTALPDLTEQGGNMDRGHGAQNIPLYSIEGGTGLSSLFASKLKPVDYIHIPNLPKSDGAVYVSGESMYPLLKSGDIVIYKQMSDPKDIFWGDMYLLSIEISGQEYVSVKYIHKSEQEGHIRLVSHNPSHADKDIELSRIHAIGFVMATIRVNSIG